MTFLPIVERELRVASRRRSTYLGRMAGAVIALAIGGWIMLTIGQSARGVLGMVLFGPLSVMLFLYSLAAGARMTADCLSEEKREGTLGLLFLTDLKGFDVVAGKLAANSLNTFYGLLSAFPVLAISLLMGGVTSTEFWRVSLVALNLLFLSLSVGMFASAISRDERKANAAAFLILLVLLGATPLVELGLNIANRHRSSTTEWLVFSPAFSCFSAFGARGGMKPYDFWMPVAMTQVYSWLLLALSCVIVPRSWQDKSANKSIPFKNLWRKILSTDRKKEDTRRARLLDANPFLWLTARDRLKTVFLWTTLLVLASVWIWGLAKWQNDWLEIPNYIFTAFVLHLIFKFWIASEACHRFLEDRKNSALELLLSTPLSVEEILRGQRMALYRQFGGPVAVILAVDLLFMILSISHKDINQSDERVFMILLWFVGMAIFVMDLFALSWVSMWLGLTKKKVNQASNGAISRVLVLPWLVFFGSMTVVGTASLFAGLSWDEEIVLFYWFALAVIINVVCINWAKRNLLTRFRDMATQRFATKTQRSAWFNTRKKSTLPAELPPVINLR